MANIEMLHTDKNILPSFSFEFKFNGIGTIGLYATNSSICLQILTKIIFNLILLMKQC